MSIFSKKCDKPRLNLFFTAFLSHALIFWIFSGGQTFALGETVLKFGGKAGWEQFKRRDGLTELDQVRPYKVLALNSISKNRDDSLDMALFFDEKENFIDSVGNYTLQTPKTVYIADASRARFGPGAAIFSGASPRNDNVDDNAIVLRARRYDALFSAGRNIGDFSIDFWLYPVSMENGEEPFSWTASIQNGGANSRIQNLSCAVSKNRMEWTMSNFFFEPPNGTDLETKSINVRLVSSAPIIPKRWSHHLIRFNVETGLLEYLVNGVLEDIGYATASGAEDGHVFSPVAGERGSFSIGKRFNGMIDHFRIYSRFVEEAELNRYQYNGRVRSAPIDLGAKSSVVLRVEAVGGIYNTFAGNTKAKNKLNDDFSFQGGAQMQFFIRASDSPYIWDEKAWRSFTPGSQLNTLRGRYIELAVDFYPGGDFETTPYLEDISVVFAQKAAPAPPATLQVTPQDGAVELSWKPSKDENAAGYLVYYGTAPGNYLGDDAALGHSPINVEKQTSVNIDNLKNGILYYFSVSAYDNLGMPGDYSREISVRPLRVFE
ncbi:MAG: fibronectin type III domain-containing protein [Treponema sp.]|jgi:hypothetical protein|nr:fibronectin type III domain-containing protein [Treponema sp.]